MTYTVVYEPARPPCSGSCRPGTLALMRTVVESHPRLRSLGCYNCRNVRNSTGTLSVHAVGRATDIGFLAPSDQTRHGGQAGQWLQQVCDALIADYETVGCQQIIYAARIWRVGRDGWRDFDGASGDHHDHAHIELVSAAAETLTADVVAGVLATIQEDDLTPEQAKKLDAVHAVLVGNRVAFEGDQTGASHDLASRIIETAHRVGADRKAVQLAPKDKTISEVVPTLAAIRAAVAAEVAKIPPPAGGGGPSPVQVADAVIAALTAHPLVPKS